MLRLAAIAALGALSAATAANALIKYELRSPAEAAAEPQLRGAQSVQPQASDPQAAQVVKAADGHYWAEGVVNGAQVRFLVDTGASAVALTLADAQRLGIDPSKLTYASTVATANGMARAARVKLASVAIAGASVADVDAYVIDKGLSTSLLGMSYLGRLQKFEATQTALILRP